MKMDWLSTKRRIWNNLDHCSGDIQSDCIPQVEHVELDEFLEIIADIQDAGWAVKVVRENEMISDQVAEENIWRKIFQPHPGIHFSSKLPILVCSGFEACV